MNRRPKYVPRSIWYRDLVDRYTDRVWQFWRCHFHHDHVVKISTYPNCIWCGRKAR